MFPNRCTTSVRAVNLCFTAQYARRNIKRIAETVADVPEAIELLSGSCELRLELGEIAHNYFQERHTIDYAMQDFLEFFAKAVR